MKAALTFSHKRGRIECTLPEGWDELSPEQLAMVWRLRLLHDEDTARIKALLYLCGISLWRLARARRFWGYFYPMRRRGEAKVAYARRKQERLEQLNALKRALDWVVAGRLNTKKWLLAEIVVDKKRLIAPPEDKVAWTAEQWMTCEDLYQHLARHPDREDIALRLVAEIYQPEHGYSRGMAGMNAHLIKRLKPEQISLIVANYAALSANFAESFPHIFKGGSKGGKPFLWKDYARKMWTEPQQLADNIRQPPDLFMAALEGQVLTAKAKKNGQD